MLFTNIHQNSNVRIITFLVVSSECKFAVPFLPVCIALVRSAMHILVSEFTFRIHVSKLGLELRLSLYFQLWREERQRAALSSTDTRTLIKGLALVSKSRLNTSHRPTDRRRRRRCSFCRRRPSVARRSASTSAVS